MAERGRPKLVDVAAAAAVSVSAASVALNGRPGVSEETRARIHRVARKIGYVPDVAAASLRSGRSCLVGFVADAPDHPSLPSLAEQVTHAGCLLVLGTPASVGYLEARGVDAAVVVGSDKAARAWARSGRPLVVLGSGRLPRGAVRVDDGDAEDVARRALAILLA